MGHSQFKAGFGDFFLHSWLGKVPVNADFSGEEHVPTLTVKVGEPWQSQQEVSCPPNSVKPHPNLAKTCLSCSLPSMAAPSPCTWSMPWP